MPSTKPQILIKTKQKLINKLNKITKKQNRSKGNLAETIIKDYVEKYEMNQIIKDIINSQETNEKLKLGKKCKTIVKVKEKKQA